MDITLTNTRPATGSDELTPLPPEVETLRKTVARVQNAAKTIMIGEAEELKHLRAQSKEHYAAIRTLDSERAMNTQLTEDITKAEAENKRLLSAARYIMAILQQCRAQ